MKVMADIEMLREHFFEWQNNKLIVQIMKKRRNKNQVIYPKWKNAWNDTKDSKNSKYLPYILDPGRVKCTKNRFYSPEFYALDKNLYTSLKDTITHFRIEFECKVWNDLDYQPQTYSLSSKMVLTFQFFKICICL